jgi:hypothetical protein
VAATPVMLLRAARPRIDARDRPERGSPDSPQQRKRIGKCVASSGRIDLRNRGTRRRSAQQRSSAHCLKARPNARTGTSRPAHRLSRAASECTTSAVDNPLVEAGRARFSALVHSNQRLSNIVRLKQIVENHREPSAHRNGPRWRRADVAAREWATFNARARVERVSREPLWLLRRITSVSRGAACGRLSRRAGMSAFHEGP